MASASPFFLDLDQESRSANFPTSSHARKTMNTSQAARGRHDHHRSDGSCCSNSLSERSPGHAEQPALGNPAINGDGNKEQSSSTCVVPIASTENGNQIAMANGHSKNALQRQSIRKPKRNNSHRQRVRWNGFIEKVEPVGYNCCLCDVDVAHPPSSTPDDQKTKQKDFADVAVLACGHVFHTRCLNKLVPIEQLTDPHCILCAR